MSQDLAKAHALNALTVTPAWRVVEEVMDAIVADFVKELVDCDDDLHVLRRQHAANTAKRFATEFRTRISAGSVVAVDEFQTVNY